MALRILFLLLGAILVINIVLSCCGLIFGVNLYQKYGKQILIFFVFLILFVVISFITLSLVGLIK